MSVNRVDTKFSNSNVVALTQQNALKRQMEAIAQNIANMNTTAAGSTSIHIDPSGNIIGSGGGLGAFSLSMFENEQALIAKGAGLYETTQVPLPATNARVEQGGLEGSNVNSVIEATKLIDVSRMYEQNQAFMQKTDQKTKDVIEKVGKV
jgi:flagellar basal-body rod protein FlgF